MGGAGERQAGRRVGALRPGEPVKTYLRIPLLGLFSRNCLSFFLFRFGLLMVKFPLLTRVA